MSSDRNPSSRSFQKNDKCSKRGGVGHMVIGCCSIQNKPHNIFKATWSDSEFESSFDLDEDTLVFVVLVVLVESFEDDDSDVNLLTFTLGYCLLSGLCLLY